MNKTVAFATLGCKLNYAETATYERALQLAGVEAVPWGTPADVCLINTCSVTATADKKSRNLIRQARRFAPQALIAVTGCYAELKRGEIEAIEGVWRVFGAREKARVVPDTLAALAMASVPPSSHSGQSEGIPDTFGAWSAGEERTRSFLKVQDGCNNYCAYCTVPFARGASRNLPICEVLRCARDIAAAGVKEVVLTGVNTGDFGRTSGESFLDLLKALNGVEGIERYRISSIEPNLITDDIIDWIASGTKFQPHFHIPLQTGSDSLLKRVGRRYDTAQFAGRIERIRHAMEGPGKPKVFFGIDVITGLPGETEALFEETFRFLEERIRPAFLHIFPYSRRDGTRAAAWPDQVPAAVKAGRVKRLEALSDRLHAAFIEANRGVRERVLWESTEHDGLMSGYSGNYIRVSRPYDPAAVNTLSDIVL